MDSLVPSDMAKLFRRAAEFILFVSLFFCKLLRRLPGSFSYVLFPFESAPSTISRWTNWSFIVLPPAVFFYIYILLNDYKLRTTPTEVISRSPCTPKFVHMLEGWLKQAPISTEDYLPPRTGRRYIVVGGGGFVGGWIVACLLARGEDPKRIRILDLRPPIRRDLSTGKAKDVQFIRLDITDSEAVHAAFSSPWSDTESPDKKPDITVFHTASNIRFYERHEMLLPASERVNVHGTQNIIKASLAVGADILLYTSSGSVAIKSMRFFLWPWQCQPRNFVQVLRDDDSHGKDNEVFFSNYAATKMRAERIVRAVDKTPTGTFNRVLRTGCLRPGNGIFGPGGDMLYGAFLERGRLPTWAADVVQSCCYVENCALAHLCYEQRLLEIQAQNDDKACSGSKMLPDIGGQAFFVTDAGPVRACRDAYTTLATLTSGQFTYFELSPTLCLLVAHLVEAYYLMQHRLSHAGSHLIRWAAAKFMPVLTGDIVNLQPSTFAVTSAHIVIDDSRARLPAERGGLGYRGPWTTLAGLHKTVQEHQKIQSYSDVQSSLI